MPNGTCDTMSNRPAFVSRFFHQGQILKLVFKFFVPCLITPKILTDYLNISQKTSSKNPSNNTLEPPLPYNPSPPIYHT